MLFNTISEFNVFVESNNGMDYTSVLPSILAAEIKFLKPVFGTAFYDYLINQYQNGTQDNQVITNLIYYAQQALAPLALYLYIPVADVQITDAGIRRGDSDKAPGAFKYQVKDLQKAYLERGFQYLEEMIEYMDANASNEKLSSWIDASEYGYYRSLFIKTGKEFEQFYTTIRYPRRIFTLLRSTMYNVQELTIADSISQELYDLFKSRHHDKSPTWSDSEAKLLSYLKPAIAHLTIGRGIANLVATMDENGVHVLTQFGDHTSNISNRTAASDSNLSMMVTEALSAGAAWLDKAVNYLDTVSSPNLFPSWYAAMNAEEVTVVTENDNLTGLFSM